MVVMRHSATPAAELLGEAMGVILQSDYEKTIYIVGDTIWINDA